MSSIQTQLDDETCRKKLLDARIAFDQGDFATVRKRLTPVVMAAEVPEDVKRDATKLMAAIGTDRAAIILAVGCAIFFVLVVVQYVL